MHREKSVRRSRRQWLVPVADAFLIGTRSHVSRLVRVPPEFRELVTKIDDTIGDGITSVADICTSLEREFPPVVVADAVHKLSQLGVFELNATEDNGAVATSHKFGDYMASNAESSDSAISRLKASRLVLFGHGKVAEASLLNLVGADLSTLKQYCSPAEEQSTLCEAREVDDWTTLSPDEEELTQADLYIACADDPADRLRLFPHVNRMALASKRPWITCFVEGDEFFVGPLFVPFETGCFQCLEGREEALVKNIDEHRAFKSFVRSNSVLTVAHALPSTYTIAGSAVATEAIRCLSRLTFPVTYETMVQVNVLNWDVRHHRLLRMPFCETCGPQQDRPFRYAWGL